MVFASKVSVFKDECEMINEEYHGCNPKLIGSRFLIQQVFKNHFSNLYRVVIFLLLLLFSLSLSAQSPLTQLISFETNNTPISDALIDLSEVADINIAFHPRLFSTDQTISLSIQNQPVTLILRECLAKTSVTFKIEDNHLILYEKPKKSFTLSGFIEDAKTGERLIAATVWEARSGKGTTTNDYGFFSLKIPEGTVELQSSYLGYQGKVQTLTHSRSQKINIALQPSITLEEIIITDSEFEKKEVHINLGKGKSLSLNTIKNSVPLAGEADVLRYMNTLAGVQSGADGFGGLHVRGGNADQNLVLMDGVPVYNPSHTLGLFSIFNTNVVKSAHLLKDGFSAKYGGRLSSIMDIRIKEGNTKSWSGEGEIGTIASKLLFEGPLKKDQTGLLIAARHTHIDPIIRQISRQQKEDKEEEGEVNYHFSDLNVKFSHRFSNKDQLFISGYTGKDSFEDSSYYEFEEETADDYFLRIEDREQAIKWGNKIAALRWNHLFSDRLFSNTTLTLSNYDYQSLNIEWFFLEDETEADYYDDFLYTTFQSTIRDGGVKTDFEYYPSTKYQVLFGGSYLSRSFESGILEYLLDSAPEETDLAGTEEFIDELYDLPRFDATEATAYIENKVAFTDQLSFMAGLHFAVFFTNDRNYFLPQPRLNLLWKFHPNWQTSLSGSTMAQFLHVLSTSGSGLPNDLWVPSTQNVRPQEAWQVAWTTKFRNDKSWGFTLEAYYKKLNHLITYAETANLPSLFEFDPSFWEEEITFGQGKSYGISTTLEKRQGQLTGQLNYAYTISERQFEGLNNDQSFPFRFNHPHEIKITGQYQLNSVIALNLNWQYGSGQPISLVKTNTRFAPLNNLNFDESERIGTINGSRLPAYHRLDVGVYFQWQRPTIAHHLHLGVYNVYNRKNPYYVYLYEDEDFPEESGPQQQNALPILPSLSYRLVFF